MAAVTTSQYASRVAAAVVAGAVGMTGLEGRLNAQDFSKISYDRTNLKTYEVPDVAGLKPYHTKWLDKTDAIPGKETRMDFYDVDGVMVFTYSHQGKLYSVGMDFDKKAPVDVGLIDRTGRGDFERLTADKPFSMPTWVR